MFTARGFACLCFAMLAASPASAEMMNASSNDTLQAFSKPGRYSALNLLDGDKSTVWCSAGTGQDSTLVFQFSDDVRIDRVEIAMGNQSSMQAFTAYNRVRSLTVSYQDTSWPMELQDKPGRQTMNFEPSLNTDRVAIRLTAGYRGKQHRHTCISDVIFYSGRKALTGAKLKKSIRKARRSLEFMDTWVSGPQLNRTHLLVFGLDNKVRLQFVPHDPTEDAVRKQGSFRIVRGSPEIKVDRDWVKVLVKRDDAGRVQKLKLQGLGALDGVYVRHSLSYIH
jgi:hypothetical protein